MALKDGSDVKLSNADVAKLYQQKACLADGTEKISEFAVQQISSVWDSVLSLGLRHVGVGGPWP